MTRRLPLLCLDVDGVVHGYQSGWQGADQLPDDPVPGAMHAIRLYVDAFRVALYSARSGQPGGIPAMQHWLRMHLVRAHGAVEGRRIYDLVEWPTSKPAAFATIDDRAIRFTGKWPGIVSLKAFKPWNHVEADAALDDETDDQVEIAREVAEIVDEESMLNGERLDTSNFSPELFLKAIASRGLRIARSS